VHVHEHHGAGHTHAHHDHPRHGSPLFAALLLTLGFAGVEALAGWWSGSLALLADAAHMLTDGSALALAAGAAWLAKRPPSLRHSYGFARAEVLAALVNSLLMLVLLGFIVREAIGRIGTPRDIHGGAVVSVAVAGLAVNLAVAWLLSRGEQTINSRAALLHVLGDALGSVAAIAAGLVILVTGWTPIDPLLSLLVAALILVSALRLLREAVHVLMEGVPFDLRLDAIGRELATLDGVLRVHDLHVWTLTSGSVALSAHVEIRTLADWPRILDAARHVLDAHHGIHHVTLQPEPLTPQPLMRHPQAHS
jgi:cobalt-zinc-cadmium efflux system protein